MTALHGVRVDTDGTLTDITTTLPGLFAFAREQLAGAPEYAYYGTSKGAITVAVHETSINDGHPVNDLVTRFVEDTRRGPLGYRLHGVALVFGFDGREDITSLQPDFRDVLHSLKAQAVGKAGEDGVR